MHGALDRQKDEQILMALHLVENVGLTHKDAAHLVGMTKNACIGAIARVRNEKTGVHSIIRNPAKERYGGLIRHRNLGYQCLIRLPD